MPKAPDLDTKIAALQQAVAASDQAAMARLLEAIEEDLERMNPLMRGMAYAHVQSVLGRPAAAVAVVEDLLELMPDDAVVYFQLGCYRRSAQDPDGALAAFTRATELDVSRVDAWIGRGTLLDARGEPHAAIEAYRQVVLRAPAEVDGWRNLGNSLAALGHFDQAIEAYRTASGLRPGEPTLAFLQASAHQAKGELEHANGLLPAELREELGEVVEVRRERDGRDLCCRFHGPKARLERRRAAAHGLLLAVAEELGGEAALVLPLARADSLVVQHGRLLMLCDVDPVRPGLPNRFFDATGVVERAAKAAAAS